MKTDAYTGMFQRTGLLVRNIAHDCMQPLPDLEESINLKSQTSRIESDISRINGDIEYSPIPDIYNSSKMKCIFETGFFETGFKDAKIFHHASFEAERDTGEWNGAGSGVDPWESVQRLAKQPKQTERQYKNCNFKKFTNINAQGRCMEPLKDSNHEGMALARLAPRTWVIGATLHFLNPPDRTPGASDLHFVKTHDRKREPKNQSADAAKKNARVSPAPAASRQTRK